MIVDNKEINFVIIRGNKPVEIIQVAYDVADPTVLGRELDAIKLARTKIGDVPAKIIVGTTYSERILGNIEIIPYWEWETKIMPNQTI